MRRSIALVGAWCLGCGVATTLGIGAIDRALGEVSRPVVRPLDGRGMPRSISTADTLPAPTRSATASVSPRPSATPRPSGAGAHRGPRTSATASATAHPTRDSGRERRRRPAPEGSRTFPARGGTVSVHCTTSRTIALDLAAPDDGYTMSVENHGPERVDVSFRRGASAASVHVTCVGGEVRSAWGGGDDGEHEGGDD